MTGWDVLTCLAPPLPSSAPSYDHPVPSCQPVYCPQLFVVDGAVIPAGRPRAGSKVFVNCEIGWNLVGPAEAWCLEDGSYDVYEVGPCIKTTFVRWVTRWFRFKNL